MKACVIHIWNVHLTQENWPKRSFSATPIEPKIMLCFNFVLFSISFSLVERVVLSPLACHVMYIHLAFLCYNLLHIFAHIWTLILTWNTFSLDKHEAEQFDFLWRERFLLSPYIVVQGVERGQIPHGDCIEIIKVISGTREDKTQH